MLSALQPGPSRYQLELAVFCTQTAGHAFFQAGADWGMAVTVTNVSKLAEDLKPVVEVDAEGILSQQCQALLSGQ